MLLKSFHPQTASGGKSKAPNFIMLLFVKVSTLKTSKNARDSVVLKTTAVLLLFGSSSSLIQKVDVKLSVKFFCRQQYLGGSSSTSNCQLSNIPANGLLSQDLISDSTWNVYEQLSNGGNCAGPGDGKIFNSPPAFSRVFCKLFG